MLRKVAALTLVSAVCSAFRRRPLARVSRACSGLWQRPGCVARAAACGSTWAAGSGACSAFVGDCSPACRARAAACGSAVRLCRACCGLWSTWAAGSGVQRFLRRFSFEIRTRGVVMDLLRSPSRVLIEVRDFDSRRRGKIPQKGFFEKILQQTQNSICPQGASVSTTSPFSSTDQLSW